ncbi:MAG TPA: hypothetical protein DDW65_11420, partial [Firmicutes bacterium]|nr:hypothetical protein [Bacillota bacterium]
MKRGKREKGKGKKGDRHVLGRFHRLAAFGVKLPLFGSASPFGLFTTGRRSNILQLLGLSGIRRDFIGIPGRGATRYFNYHR